MPRGYPRPLAARHRFATMASRSPGPDRRPDGARSMATRTNSLSLTAREPEGSRSARRLRRDGLVPGVLFGGGDEPQHFAVDGRILRNTLAHSGAILQVSVDGGTESPVLVKDVQRHPV